MCYCSNDVFSFNINVVFLPIIIHTTIQMLVVKCSLLLSTFFLYNGSVQTLSISVECMHVPSYNNYSDV